MRDPFRNASRLGGLLLALAVPAAANTLHVPGDASTIQGAIALAASGDTILVAPGTYTENITLLGKQLVIVGTAGAASTIIQSAAPDTVVWVHKNEPVGTQLRGFTITGGTGRKVTSSAFGGGGVVVGADSNLELRECIISGNSVLNPNYFDTTGGGLWVGKGSSISLLSCSVTGNAAQHDGAAVSGFITGEFTFTATDCTFTDNDAGPGGFVLYALGGSGSLENCLIADNIGTGLWRVGNALELQHCTFRGNTEWGFGNYSDGGSSIADCSFEGNGLGGVQLYMSQYGYGGLAERCTFTQGDVLWMEGGDLWGGSLAINCTLDGAHIEGSTLVDLRNCIVRNTPTPAVGASTILASYCNIEGGLPGVGNIDADPLWANPAAGDYSLLPGSPCINTGDPTFPPDADGSPVDMGAVPYDPWTDLGGGVAGGAGLPQLAGTGPLTAGDALSLELTGAPAFTSTLLFVGGSPLGVPFKGGVFWPTPSLVLGGLVTDANGALSLPTTWPVLPSGISFWAQSWFPDAGAPHGAAGSNGLRGVAP